ncbi:MAG: asparagine synthase (glutamine-hydrolyzing) [Ruminococcus sp.]|jgi:asparagine synthase (glutamine-hydrolysing)|nr:asparagine synthase (glutamine-hydrolyzing) [Ruminococcus sp.]
MCGIAGWIDNKSQMIDKLKILENMSLTLSRRGPDDSGIYINKNTAIIHRRLTVVDPEGGRQPMSYETPHAKYTIVYNGELYNTEDIRKDLKALGHEFNGHSDTEVLLHSFAEWGTKCTEKLNGIYAFAVLTESGGKNTVFLARDRVGVKPLFLYEYSGGLIFGSEIKTLLANPLVPAIVDSDGIKEIFMLGPARTPGETPIRGITELLPAEQAVYEDGSLTKNFYWRLEAYPHRETYEQSVEHIRFLITDAVERQLVSDVPLCTFLSGGLDSSIISKIAADKYKSEGRQLDTWSVDYIDNEKYFTPDVFQPNSDRHYIEIMSNFIGSNHHYVNLHNHDLAPALFEAVYARDLPGMADVDSSLLLFCREVKKEFTVAVSGECADELLGGYPWYHNPDILFENTFPWSNSTDLRLSVLREGLISGGKDYVRRGYMNTCLKAPLLDGESKTESRMREMFKLNLDWFMACLLDRKDRMSMYSGLEVRVPFSDHRIVEFAYNMPWNIKSRLGKDTDREKGIVREAFRDILPEEIVFRKKSPYPKTHNPIYTQAVCDIMTEIIADKEAPICELINHETVEELIQNPTQMNMPWYGQLMRGPQILAYLIQTNEWLKTYKIDIKI